MEKINFEELVAKSRANGNLIKLLEGRGKWRIVVSDLFGDAPGIPQDWDSIFDKGIYPIYQKGDTKIKEDVEKALYRHRVPADLFFSRWLAFIRQAEDERYYQRSALRRTMIRTLYMGTLQRLAFSLACNLKYWLADFDMDEILQGLVIKVPFHLTMGEYLGAQKPVFHMSN